MHFSRSDGIFLAKDENITVFTNEKVKNYAKNNVPFALETALIHQGKKFHPGMAWSARSIVDGDHVTGQNPPSAKNCSKYY